MLFRDQQPVKVDGTFEIAGILPRSYQLFVSAPGVHNYAAYVSFSVEQEAPGEKPAPLDLGEIKVKGSRPKARILRVAGT